MLGHRDMNTDDYLSILRRRKWWIIIPAFFGPVLGYGVSQFIPAQYTSQTTVLVENQRVPWVQSVVSDTLNQRLSTMKDQILSRNQLQPIIEKYQLYKGENAPMEDLIGRMRSKVVVKPITTQPGSGPIAVSGFSIAFTDSDPHVAQQVTGQILSMFIEQNVKLRESRAQDTTNFFSAQLDEAKRKLDEQDQKVSDFKRRFMDQLPGTEAQTLGRLAAANSQYETATQALSRAIQDKQFTETILANQLAAWKASQSGANPVTIDAQLTALESQLADAQARYTADHPDVLKLKAQIEQLKKKADSAAANPAPRPSAASTVEPPQIAQLRAQLHQYDLTIADRTRDQERMKQQVNMLTGKLQLSPAVEQEYKQITRDYNTALEFYNDLLQKKTQSEMSTNLEKRQQGEQFKVMDSPNLPERPTFPDRPMFAAGGLGLGLVLGLGLAFLLEMRDGSLRTELDIEHCLQVPALVCLPSVDLLESHPARRLTTSRSEG